MICEYSEGGEAVGDWQYTHKCCSSSRCLLMSRELVVAGPASTAGGIVSNNSLESGFPACTYFEYQRRFSRKSLHKWNLFSFYRSSQQEYTQIGDKTDLFLLFANIIYRFTRMSVEFFNLPLLLLAPSLSPPDRKQIDEGDSGVCHRTLDYVWSWMGSSDWFLRQSH